MASLPEYRRRNFVENIGVVRTTGGEGLMAAGAGLGVAAAAYTAKEKEDERAAEAGHVAQIELDNRAWVAEEATKPDVANDPQAFKARLEGRLKGLVEEQPSERLKAAVQRGVGAAFNSAYVGLLNSRAAADRALQNRSWSAQVDAIAGDMGNLAEVKGVNSKEYLAAASRHEDLLRTGIEAKFIDDSMAQVRRDQIAAEGEGRAISSFAVVRAQASLGEGKSIADAKRAALDVLDREMPVEGMSDARRITLRNRVEARLNEWSAERREELNTIREDGRDLLGKLSLGYPVDQARLDSLARRASALGEPGLANDYREAQRHQQLVSSFAKLPPAQQAVEYEKAVAVANRPETGVEAARLAAAYGHSYQANVKAWKDDPLLHASRQLPDRVGKLDPINWADQEGVTAVLRKRVGQAAFASEYSGLPVPAMTEPEIAGLKTLLTSDSTTASDKARLAATLVAGLGRSIGPVLQRVTKDDDLLQTFGVAVGVSLDNPKLARDIFVGLDHAKADKGLLPKDADARPVVRKTIGSAFSENPRAGQGVRQAADALYAQYSVQEGDKTGTFNKSRYERALTAIVGNTVEWQGRRILPPTRDMSAQSFGALMAGLNDSDLIVNPDGRPNLANDDGTVSTERSITVEAEALNGGKPTNIPSIWNGKELDEGAAIAEAVKSGQTFPSFGTIEAAVAAAKARSEAIGHIIPRALDGRPVTAEMIRTGRFRLHSAGDGQYYLERDGEFVSHPINPSMRYRLDLSRVPMRTLPAVRVDSTTRAMQLSPLPGGGDAPAEAP